MLGCSSDLVGPETNAVKCRACGANPQAMRARMQQAKVARAAFRGQRPVIAAPPAKADVATVDAILAGLRRYTGKTIVHEIRVESGKVIGVLGAEKTEVVLVQP